MNSSDEFNLSCPVPIENYPRVLLAHGGGGRLMHQLIEKIFAESFKNDILDNRHDGATLNLPARKLAFTTDSYVVSPLFFPGGDIGSLSVYGTTNDLAMCGARPMYISAGFIIEEGFPMQTLWEVAQSMKSAAQKAGVQIVTGDTKVVDKGKGDGVFINTAGIGIFEHDFEIGPGSIKDDDVIILSGDIGRHGIAIMASREGLQFETTIASDCAPLWENVEAILKAGIEIHCLRDLTRGGLASVLIELAEQSDKQFIVEENAIEVNQEVQAACEILGFDPIYVANEGRFIAFVRSKDVIKTMAALEKIESGSRPSIIGGVSGSSPGTVIMKSKIGAERVVDMLSGEQLPRIC